MDRDLQPGATAPVRSRRAFWIGLSLHVLAGEWWIRTTPDKTG
jgi:hypothetical protein